MKRVDVLVGDMVIGGRIVIDPPAASTIILRNDVIVQRGGTYRRI